MVAAATSAEPILFNASYDSASQPESYPYPVQETHASNGTTPALTQEQYNQLLQVLSKHSTVQEKSNTENLGAAGFLAGKRFCFLTTIEKDTWIIDSGDSDHITPNLSLLHNVRPIQYPCCITMPNGRQASIRNVGSVFFSSGMELRDVLHIPEFQFNLLSISKLTR